jgi:hypothetical protein
MYQELDCELLLLAAAGNKKEVLERLRDMTPEEKRLLRTALSTLDECLDADALDRHLNRE